MVNNNDTASRREIKSVLGARALNRLLSNMAKRTTFRQTLPPRWINSFYYDTVRFDYLNSKIYQATLIGRNFVVDGMGKESKI